MLMDITVVLDEKITAMINESEQRTLAVVYKYILKFFVSLVGRFVVELFVGHY